MSTARCDPRPPRWRGRRRERRARNGAERGRPGRRGCRGARASLGSSTRSSVTSSRRPRSAPPSRRSAATAASRIVELSAVEAEVRDLARRCTEKITTAPRLAVPDVAALGPVPGIPDGAGDPGTWRAARAELEGYLGRLDRVAAAFAEARRRFEAPLDERGDLRGLLTAYRDRANRFGLAEDPTLAEAFEEARGTCGPRPATWPGPDPWSPSTKRRSGLPSGPTTRPAPNMRTTDERRAVRPTGLHRSDRGRLLQRLRFTCRAPRSRQRADPAAASHTGVDDRHRRVVATCRRRRSARPAPDRRPTRRVCCRPGRRTQHLGAGITTVPVGAGPRPAVGRARRTRRSPRTSGSAPRAVRPVGRSRDGRPGRTEGFCPKCRTAVLVRAEAARRATSSAGSTRWSACIAHGGLGWIYLARDRNVSDRYVVLKGLLNTGDQDAFEAAVAERQFLAAGAAPAHRRDLQLRELRRRRATSSWSTSAASSLKQILKDRMAAQQRRVRPVPRRPGDRLHRRDPARVRVPALAGPALLRLQARQRDPGRRHAQADRPRRRAPRRRRPVAIYGTVGFQAPEVAEVGPSVASDIFTIGRTLAVLAMEFRGYQIDATSRRCRRSTTPRCSSGTTRSTGCCARPPRRIPTTGSSRADELRDQLLGVLREVRAPSTAAARGRRTRARRRCSAPPTAHRCRARLGPTSRRCASTAPTRPRRGSPGVSVARSASSGSTRARSRRRSTPSRCSSRRCARASRPAQYNEADELDRGACSPTTRGSGGPCGCRASRRVGPRRRRRGGRPRSTPCSARFRASWRRSLRSRSPASTPASATSPSSSTRCARRPTPTTSRRRRSGLARA